METENVAKPSCQVCFRDEKYAFSQFSHPPGPSTTAADATVMLGKAELCIIDFKTTPINKVTGKAKLNYV